MRFTNRLLWTAKMQQAEIHHHRIECRLRKRKLLGIVFTKVDAGIPSLCLLNHRRRKVDSDCGCAARYRGSRDIAGAARDIKHLSAFRHAGGIQKSWDALYSDGRKA